MCVMNLRRQKIIDEVAERIKRRLETYPELMEFAERDPQTKAMLPEQQQINIAASTVLYIEVNGRG